MSSAYEGKHVIDVIYSYSVLYSECRQSICDFTHYLKKKTSPFPVHLLIFILRFDVIYLYKTLIHLYVPIVRQTNVEQTCSPF